jgi:hypothetical protein
MNDIEAEKWLRAVLRLAGADAEAVERMITEFNARKNQDETVADMFLREIADEIKGGHA